MLLIPLAALVLAAPPDMPAQAAAAVSPDRLKADVEKLAAFGTRHTLSDSKSPTRGIGAAREWLKSELTKAGEKSNGSMTVEFEPFDAPPAERIPNGAHIVNVVGVLKGTDEDAAKRRVYIVGHYDSRNGKELDATNDAPGANDDASGTASVLEAARVLADQPLRATVVFLCSAGEEQRLYGATYRASQAAAAGEDIVAVLNNDIIGDPATEAGGDPGVVRVFSENVPRNPPAELLAKIRAAGAEFDSPSRQLARFVEETGRDVPLIPQLKPVRVDDTGITPRLSPPVLPKLVFRPDRFMRGGDHSAFNDAGYAAVRFTTGAEVYDRQHADVTQKDGKPYGDVPAFVDAAYLAGVARLNVATIVRLAMAPPPPKNVRILTGKNDLNNTTRFRWSANHDPLTDHYELVWRDTTEPLWTHSKPIGLVSELAVDTSKDNNFFGVRAVSKDGYKSVVSFAMSAKE